MSFIKRFLVASTIVVTTLGAAHANDELASAKFSLDIGDPRVREHMYRCGDEDLIAYRSALRTVNFEMRQFMKAFVDNVGRVPPEIVAAKNAMDLRELLFHVSLLESGRCTAEAVSMSMSVALDTIPKGTTCVAVSKPDSDDRFTRCSDGRTWNLSEIKRSF